MSKHLRTSTDPDALFVAHNLSEEKLRHVIKLGGLAAPSLAVVRNDVGFDRFGEITLLASPDMANPRKRGVRAFASDIYSPRQPRAEYDIDRKAYADLEKALGKAAGTLGCQIDECVTPSDLAREGLQSLLDADLVKMAYLMEMGDAPRIRYREAQRPDSRLLKFRSAPDKLVKTDAFKAVVSEIVSDLIAKAKPESGEIIKSRLLEADENGTLRPSAKTLATYAKQLESYRKPRQPDGIEMSRAIRKKMLSPKRRRDFRGWVSHKFGPVLKKSYFRTERGQRKAYQLELLVREMTRTLRDGEGWQYGLGSVRSVMAPEFASVSEIKESRDKVVSTSDFEGLKKDMDAKLFELADKFAPHHGSSKDFGWLDIFCEFLKELHQGKLQNWQKNIFDTPVSDDLVAEARKFNDALRAMPTEYFEIKMQRPVAIDEFSAALVPTTTSKDTIDYLKNAGLQVVRYKHDPETDNRSEALSKIKDEVFFQRPVFEGKSKLLEAVEKAKQPKATAADWKSIVRKMVQKFPGVTNDEADFIGLYDWLDQMGRESLTREDVAKYIEGHKIEIIEKTYSGEEPAENSYGLEIGGWIEPSDAYVNELVDEFEDEAREALRSEAEDLSTEDEVDAVEVELSKIRERAWSMAYDFAKGDDYYAKLVDHNGDGDDIDCIYNQEMGTVWIEDEGMRVQMGVTDALDEDSATQIANAYAEDNSYPDGIDGPAQFSEYTEDGGDEYLEIVLTVPNLDNRGKNARDIEDAMKVGESRKRLQSLTEEYHSNPSEERKLELTEEMTEVQDLMNRFQQKHPFVEDAHFSEPNIVVHARVKIRRDLHGRKLLFIEEVQSDLSSAHRESGESPEVSRQRQTLHTGISYLQNKIAETARGLVFSDPNSQAAMISPINSVSGVKRAFAFLNNEVMESDVHPYLRMLSVSISKPENESIKSALEIDMQALRTLEEELLRLGPEKRNDPDLPDTPWMGRQAVNLMMKHLVRIADEHGCDQMSWTTAAQQAARWDAEAENVVEEFSWTTSDNGIKKVQLAMSHGGAFDVDVDAHGKIVWAQDQAERLTGKSLSKLLGAKVATEILSFDNGKNDGSKITFSDSGYSIVYDQQMRSFMSKLGKKYDVQVKSDTSLPDFGATYIDMNPDLDAISYDEIRNKLVSAHGESTVVETEQIAGRDLERKREEIEYNIWSLKEEISSVKTNPADWVKDADELVGKYEVKIAEYEEILDSFEVQAEKSKKARLLKGLSKRERDTMFPGLRRIIPGEAVWTIDLPKEMKADLRDNLTMFRAPGLSDLKIKKQVMEDILPALEDQLKGLKITGVDLSVDTGAKNQGQVTFKGNGDISILIGNSLDHSHTLNHEAIHVLRRRNLFTDQEWDALRQEAEKDWIARYQIEKRYPEFSRETHIEEAIAEAYADKATGRKPKGIIVQAFLKIKKVLQAVHAVLTQENITTPEQVFERVSSGEVGSRFDDEDVDEADLPSGLSYA
ncbi:hypothetical protein [Sulfitobacter sp. R18_1]|uniref:hypothetical protein n=1 Tax=Sulfitobacter sp. R18_1 TaxID=2821104 RepID=UPI001ADAC8B9|nr:hypothetical protein [Sulfitobacter sp. R18_1]MBO9427885.1 hypothetical protein [Sulfitobacter sp. R18_1]